MFRKQLSALFSLIELTNTMISPDSIYHSLVMILFGAHGETESELFRVTNLDRRMFKAFRERMIFRRKPIISYGNLISILWETRLCVPANKTLRQEYVNDLREVIGGLSLELVFWSFILFYDKSHLFFRIRRTSTNVRMAQLCSYPFVRDVRQTSKWINAPAPLNRIWPSCAYST